jgi:hypothetical protein
MDYQLLEKQQRQVTYLDLHTIFMKCIPIASALLSNLGEYFWIIHTDSYRTIAQST